MWIVREDLKAHREGLLAQGFWALLAHRIASPRARIQNRAVRIVYYAFNRIIQKLVETTTGISIAESATIGRRLNIEHFGGIIIHGSAIIGDDVTLRQGVTLGNRGAREPDKAPIVGNSVEIGAGAKLLGRINIGDGAVIGANAVVVTDVPAGALAVGVPAVIKLRPLLRTANPSPELT